MFKELIDLIPTNKDIMIHSSLGSFHSRIDTDELLHSLVEGVGPLGNILMPTFTFQFNEEKKYDVKNSKCGTGALPEIFRNSTINGQTVRRDLNPMQSVAVWGKNSNEYTNTGCETTFGQGSAFDMLYNKDGYILLLGVNYNKTTFYHYPEEKHLVPYRFWKEFPGIVTNYEGQNTEVNYKMYVRELEYIPNINHYGLLMEEMGLVSKKVIMGSIARLFKVKDLYDIIMLDLRDDPYSLVRTNRDTFKIKTSLEK